MNGDPDLAVLREDLAMLSVTSSSLIAHEMRSDEHSSEN